MNETFTGLGTMTLKALVTGTTTLNGTINLPTVGQGAAANSAVVVTINNNGGSTIYTGPAGAEGFYTTFQTTAGDSINIILTSAAAVDQGPNAIKTTVSLS